MSAARRPPDVREKCSHTRSSPASRAERVEVVWKKQGGGEAFFCHHCGRSGVSKIKRSTRGQRIQRRRSDTSHTANALWHSSVRAHGTPVVEYLKPTRGIDVELPATLRYLPARDKLPHAMIAAFGFLEEIEPGILAAPQSVTAVHLTRLSPQGTVRLDKRMLGPVTGQPIVLAPPNDALGLVITEGIEDALSVHEATGLGAWAAGSAGHLSALAPAVPKYIDHVLILADNDPPGMQNAFALHSALRNRGFDVTVKTIPEAG